MPKSPVSISLGESPLTDPRSVGSSAVFHVLVVLLASLTALERRVADGRVTSQGPLRRDRSRRQPRRRSQLTGPRRRQSWRHRRNEQLAFYSAVRWDEAPGSDP